MQTCRICDAHSADDLRYCGSCGEPLRDDVPTRTRGGRPSEVIPAGTEVGSYRLLEVLGEGGMGRVYLAEHVRLGRKVALKMLRSKYSQNPEAVKRFFTEARAVNRIAHENIVEVTDFVAEPDGSSYYIMEFLTGVSLFDAIQREKVVPLPRALAIASQVANALAAVHEAGIVHRDLKPDNIFLARRGTRSDLVKLLDFGIAKLVEPDLDISIQRTGVGALMGTPAYMSPEQASASPVDYRSDMYALGVILYELVTGVVPFQGGTYGEILVQHLTQPPRQPSKVANLPHAIPSELEKLILHCLQKDPAARPQSMREVEERVRALLAQLERGEALVSAPTWPSIPALARPDPPDDTIENPVGKGRRRLLGAAAAVVALSAAGVGGWLFLLGQGETGDEPVAGKPEARPEMVAADPAPAAPPAPVGQEAAADEGQVGLTIHSTPSGAEVFRAGEVAPLGLTPFATRLDRSAEAVVFEIRKPGFETVTQSVKLMEDVFISVGLSATPPAESAVAAQPERPVKARPGSRRKAQSATPARDRPKKADKRIDKSGVIDAFE